MRRLTLLLTTLLGLALLPPAAATATPVTVYRDAYGIPHVEAPDEVSLSYGTGYALALDRPFLLAAIRLTAQGRAAELLGEGALPADIAMRRDFYDRADVARQYTELSLARRTELVAFSAGINKGLEEVLADPARRPALFDALGYTPEPWEPTDSVSVAMLFTYAVFAGEGGAGQLRNAALLARLQDRHGNVRGRRMWEDLLWRNDPRAPSVIPRGEGSPPRRSVLQETVGGAQLALAGELAPALDRVATKRVAQSRVVARALAKLPIPKIGSYAAAVAGKRTASGGAVTIGSPQSGFSAPSVFWQLGQHAPGHECAGFTVPGLGPWTGVGWCNQHSWSLVAGNAGEQVDNYVEQVDPADPRRYRYRGEWRRMDVRRERFGVNNCAPPICATASPARTETVEFESTVHGVVTERDATSRIAITQRRAQRGNWARSLEAVAGWNTAGSLADFQRATDLANGTYNIVYGDAAGHIMYRFTGLQPVRARGIDRRLPSPGGGAFEWRGTLPTRAMPGVEDPKSGILVANQGIESKPASWWPNSSAVALSQASRVKGNRALLGRAGRLDVPKLEALNPDLLERVDAITPIFERHLRSALRKAEEPRLREAYELFDAWARKGYPRRDEDGDNLYDDPALAIFGADDFALPYKRQLWTQLQDRVFGDELGQSSAESDGRGTFQAPGTNLGRLGTLKLALDRPRRAPRRASTRSLRLRTDFVDDVRTPTREGVGELVRASLAAALISLESEYGTADMRRWRVALPTNSFGALGVASVPPFRGFDHGTYSQVVDPRAGVGRFILPPGNQAADSAVDTAAAQLGRPPRHFDDQRLAYERYGFIDMRRAAAEYRTQTESVQVLDAP